jgi:hypothetical protein
MKLHAEGMLLGQFMLYFLIQQCQHALRYGILDYGTM